MNYHGAARRERRPEAAGRVRGRLRHPVLAHSLQGQAEGRDRPAGPGLPPRSRRQGARGASRSGSPWSRATPTTCATAASPATSSKLDEPGRQGRADNRVAEPDAGIPGRRWARWRPRTPSSRRARSSTTPSGRSRSSSASPSSSSRTWCPAPRARARRPFDAQGLARHQIFPSVVKILQDYIRERVEFGPNTDIRELALLYYAQLVSERVATASPRLRRRCEKPLLPVLNTFQPVRDHGRRGVSDHAARVSADEEPPQCGRRAAARTSATPSTSLEDLDCVECYAPNDRQIGDDHPLRLPRAPAQVRARLRREAPGRHVARAGDQGAGRKDPRRRPGPRGGQERRPRGSGWRPSTTPAGSGAGTYAIYAKTARACAACC